MHNFKKASLAALGFLGSVLVLFVLLVYPYFHGQTYYYEDAAQREALAGTVDTLISGASHGYCAVSPVLLDEALGTSSYNLSGPLMPMEARARLLLKELDRNPVKTVFFELSCNAFTRTRETDGIEGDLYALPRTESLSYFFAAFQPEEYLPALSDTMNRGFHSWKALLTGEAPAIDPKNRGYLPKPSSDLSMTPEEYRSIKNQTPVNVEATWENKEPFFRMVEACQERGIEVIFITTPMSHRMLAEYTELETPHEWLLYYAQKYQVPFWDFNLWKEPLFPDETAFYDQYHLSEEGSQVFTALLSDCYRKYKNGEDFSDQFFDTYAALDEALDAQYQ